jgi:hypothetical protein
MHGIVFVYRGNIYTINIYFTRHIHVIYQIPGIISSIRCKWPQSILAILFQLLGFLAPKDFHIIWLSNILALSVPDEGFSGNASCVLILISTFYILIFYIISIFFLVYNCSKLLTDRGNYFECQKFIKSEYDCKWCQSEDKCYDSGDQTCSDTTSSANCTIEITKVKLIYVSMPSVIWFLKGHCCQYTCTLLECMVFVYVRKFLKL